MRCKYYTPYQEVHDDDRHRKEKDEKDNKGSAWIEDNVREVLSNRLLVQVVRGMKDGIKVYTTGKHGQRLS